MDKKIKKLWVNALRSGKYKQTRSTMHDKDGYCCLGVLCEVLPRPAKKSSRYYYNPCGTLLNMKAAKVAGLTLAQKYEVYQDAPTITVCYRGKKTGLEYLNDTTQLSFKQIANIIDKQL